MFLNYRNWLAVNRSLVDTRLRLLAVGFTMDTGTVKSATSCDRYRNKVILAPMVRISILPTRLLALDYGADLVYSEEIIDHKLLNCRRFQNDVLNTVDFISPDGVIVFRTCHQERSKVVLQLGTSDSQRALQAARMVEKDVSGIDVNMGCPKKFSIAGGMGAALLTNPCKVQEILTSLVRGLSVPVTCKMRVLPSLEATVQLARLIESTGVSALTVHGRTKDERPQQRNRTAYIRAVAEALLIPVIANGGSGVISTYQDIESFRRDTSASSVMLARAAQKNPTIFSPHSTPPLRSVVRSFVSYVVRYDIAYQQAKYCIQSMMSECLQTPPGEATVHSYSLHDICKAWDMSHVYVDALKARRSRKASQFEVELEAKRRKLVDDLCGDGVIVLPRLYSSHSYTDSCSPKQVLYHWGRRNMRDTPKYETTVNKEDKKFQSILSFDGRKYSAAIWGKSKQVVEQSAAMVCLDTLGVDDGRRRLVEVCTDDPTRHHRNRERYHDLEPSPSQCGIDGQRLEEETVNS